jgi:hypothetical protein
MVSGGISGVAGLLPTGASLRERAWKHGWPSCWPSARRSNIQTFAGRILPRSKLRELSKRRAGLFKNQRIDLILQAQKGARLNCWFSSRQSTIKL